MQITERRAIRAIILSEENHVLLMRIRNPDTKKAYWICPGGGMNIGESHQSALKRELQEELSLSNFTPGPEVHQRHHAFDWKGERVSQHEHFYIVHTPKFVPVITDPEEAEVLEEFRWWCLNDFASATDPITPDTLSLIVESYLSKG